MKIRFIIILLILPVFFHQNKCIAQDAEKPVSIILVIANGMGISQISAAMIANGDTLNIERFTKTGFIKTWTPNGQNIDLKNGTFPIATGIQRFNENLPDSIINNQKTILEIAKEKSKTTGFVTTGEVTGNTIAPFYCHKPYQKNEEHIVRDLIDFNLGVFIGGGRDYFKEPGGTNYLEVLEKNDYKVIEDYPKLKKSQSKKIAALVDKNEVKSAGKRGNYLELAWSRAFKSLVKNKKGFFLVIENPHIEWAARQNDSKDMIAEIIEFDKIIGQILNYVEPDNKTLVIVLCPYEVGGLTVMDGNIPEKHANLKWAVKNSTDELVPVFAMGPGAELFTGIYNNTDVFLKLKSLLE